MNTSGRNSVSEQKWIGGRLRTVGIYGVQVVHDGTKLLSVDQWQLPPNKGQGLLVVQVTTAIPVKLLEHLAHGHSRFSSSAGTTLPSMTKPNKGTIQGTGAGAASRMAACLPVVAALLLDAHRQLRQDILEGDAAFDVDSHFLAFLHRHLKLLEGHRPRAIGINHDLQHDVLLQLTFLPHGCIAQRKQLA
jgi:hypothetical protein